MMTRADRIVIAVLACIAVMASPVVAAHPTRVEYGAYVAVSGPDGVMRLSLEQDGSFVVRGLRGHVVVVIEHGSARVTESTCRDHVCMRTGAVSRPGEAIACIPNGVSVVVEGGEHELDAVIR